MDLQYQNDLLSRYLETDTKDEQEILDHYIDNRIKEEKEEKQNDLTNFK